MPKTTVSLRRLLTLAAVFLLAVLLVDRLRHHRQDFGQVWMNKHRREHLVAVADGAIAVMLALAIGALNLGGAEVTAPIKGEQVLIPEEAKGLQSFAALDTAEEVGETGTQGRRVYFVEDIA